MKNSLIILISIFLLSGCNTYKKVSKNPDKYCHLCPKEIEIKETVTIKDSIIYEIKEVEILLPRDTVFVTKQILIGTDGIITLEKTIEHNGIITTEYEIINSDLYIKSYLNDSTITVKDTSKTITHSEISNKEIKTTIHIETNKVPWWFWLLFGAGIISAFILGRKSKKII